MKRTKLADRTLPNYSVGEEIMNTVTHVVGGAMGVSALTLSVVFAAFHKNLYGIVGSAIFGFCMIALYSVSSVYHCLRPGLGKKVMQVIDHCTIYFLICGTYTVIALSAIRPAYPRLGWFLFGVEWTMAIIATILTAIDLKEYRVFSMICYIGMGWAIIPFARICMEVLTAPGFYLLLSGGIAYTIGAVLYGIGSRKKWMHSVFHIFVDIGSLLHILCVVMYAV